MRASGSGGGALGKLVATLFTMGVVLDMMIRLDDTIVVDGEPEAGSDLATVFAESVQPIIEIAGMMVEALIIIFGIVVLTMVVSLGAAVVADRDRWPRLTFGKMRRVESTELSHRDGRCVNCWAELDDAVENRAVESLVAWGLEIRRTREVRTIECKECHEASWYDYAMRAGEHDDELLEWEEDEDGDEEPRNDGAGEGSRAEGPLECPVCPRDDLKNGHGLKVHIGKQHPDFDTTEFPVAMTRAYEGESVELER